MQLKVQSTKVLQLQIELPLKALGEQSCVLCTFSTSRVYFLQGFLPSTGEDPAQNCQEVLSRDWLQLQMLLRHTEISKDIFPGIVSTLLAAAVLPLESRLGLFSGSEFLSEIRESDLLPSSTAQRPMSDHMEV